LCNWRSCIKRSILGFIFNYKFLDQQYEALYRAEERVGTLAGYFAGMAVLISCLGLYGLAAFTAQRRRKEISIRKVLGLRRTQHCVPAGKQLYEDSPAGHWHRLAGELLFDLQVAG
jgi:hypothetical protein